MEYWEGFKMDDSMTMMYDDLKQTLKVIMDNQKMILEEMAEIREEQKKLLDEIKISNFALGAIAFRNEIIN